MSTSPESGRRGAELRAQWDELFAAYSKEYPELADQLDKMQRRQLPDGWDADLPEYPADPKGAAGRDTNQKVLNIVAQRVPWLIGGSSDLAPSNKSRLTFDGAGDFEPDNRAGRNMHFGVREHAAGAVTNGLALSKIRAYQAGFLIFSDFQRGALRLSALMELPVIHLFTHDSIGVGEDGPTHQPVEQLASLRAMPGMIDMRPGDANEVVEAWRVIMPLRHDPVALILSRQALPTLDRSKYAPASGLAKGAYVLAGDPNETPEVILIATGSEVALAVSAYEQLVDEGIKARVVSMPSWELFDRQTDEYRDSVLPPDVTCPCRDRAGLFVRLAPVGRQYGRGHRDEHVRRLSPAQGVAVEVRVHSGGGGGGGEASDRPLITSHDLEGHRTLGIVGGGQTNQHLLPEAQPIADYPALDGRLSRSSRCRFPCRDRLRSRCR